VFRLIERGLICRQDGEDRVRACGRSTEQEGTAAHGHPRRSGMYPHREYSKPGDLTREGVPRMGIENTRRDTTPTFQFTNINVNQKQSSLNNFYFMPPTARFTSPSFPLLPPFTPLFSIPIPETGYSRRYINNKSSRHRQDTEPEFRSPRLLLIPNG